MNPATPGPLTVLLIAPPGDTALLADECGGRVPQFCECHDGARGPAVGWAPRGGGEPRHWRRALLLTDRDVPVAMGIDRAARVLTERTVARVNAAGTGTIRAFSVQSRYRVERHGPMQPWGVLDLCDAWVAEGARVVLLRGGREVGS